MANILNKDESVYKQEYDNFVAELRKHHHQKGTSFRHLPSINGQEIDLYLLYWLVTAQGGWEKVNSENKWEDLLESFNLSPSTCNGSLALKQIYLRFLDSYEKFYFGEDEEEERDIYFDEEDSRSRRHRQQRIVSSVPATYNESQHRVSDTVRAHYGMSMDIYQATDYDRLCLSLLSPLPNEQDFAINVATLLSNEGKHTLKLSRCPRLLDLLCAHAGVFNHHSLRNYIDENYREARGYHQVQFWQDVCRNSTVLDIIYDEKNFYPKPEETENFFAEKYVTNYTAKDAAGRLEQLRNRVENEVDESDIELFAVGRSEGTKEPNGQRVLQVATILRNISFEEDNVPILAKNLTLLRFVLLCVNSSWSNLNQTGFDILSNIASEIQLEEPVDDAVTDLMMKTLSKCIGDQDRFQVISSLDVLTKLCALQTNEELVTRMVASCTYTQLTSYLSLHDIHLLIATLECLYSLSSLGEVPCNSIVKTHSAVELLVSLVTVEAQSYGPKACILMRVVETVPQPGSMQQATAPQQQSQPLITNLKPVTSVPGQTVQPKQQLLSSQPDNSQGAPAVGQMVAPVAGSVGAPVIGATTVNAPPPNITLPKHPLPLANARGIGVAGAGPQPSIIQQPAQPPPQQHQTIAVSATGQIIPPGSLQSQAANQQVQLKVSNDEPHRVFCLSWLKATYEPAGGKSIEQNIMYKQYLASMHRMGRREVISAQHYALCIRTLFGGSTGPNKKTVGDKTESHYTGIQVRPTPLPLKLTPAQVAVANEASRQQAGTPPAPVPTTQIQHTLATQQPVPIQNLGGVSATARPPAPILQPPVVRPASVAPPPTTNPTPGQMVQIVANGQVIQGTLVSSTNNSIQLINSSGQVVQINGIGGAQLQQAAAQSQVPPPGQQVNMLQKAGTPPPPAQPVIQPGQQVIQNIVNAQGQVIQRKIITQVPAAVSQPSGQPVLMQGGQIVMQSSQPQPQQQQVVVQSGQQTYLIQQQPPLSGSQQQQNNNTTTIQTSTKAPTKSGEQILENGTSPLDGILPKDPSFGNMHDDIMQKKLTPNHTPLINGVKDNDLDYSKLNGDSNSIVGKRGPQVLDTLTPAPKKPAVEFGNSTAPLTNGLPNGAADGQFVNGNATNGTTVKLMPGGQMIVQNSANSSTTPQQQQPALVQTSSGQIYLKTNGAAVGPGQQVVNQQGKPVLMLNQDQKLPQQQQQIVKQVINTPSGQQIVRQVVVSSGAQVPFNNITPNGTMDPSARQTPPLVNGEAATAGGSSPSPSPAPSSNPSPPPPAPIKYDPTKPYLCEWAGCMQPFKTPKEVELHAIAEHAPIRLEGEDIPCLWARCDGMKRKRFSLMTHFQDKHCNVKFLKYLAVRRMQIAHNGRSEMPAPGPPPAHPGYAPNAAMHAIKRHAQEFVTPKEREMKDEKEGPVTKSIRLTASLILRNLVIYSPTGRLRIRAYESHLSTVALSNVESSRTVSQILYEMDNATEFT